MKLRNLCTVFCSAFCVIAGSTSAAAGVHSFVPESHYAVPGGGVAEIVSATPDGRYLFYTDASGKQIGIVDILDPASPLSAGRLSTGDGEPTSCAVSPDGRYLIFALRNGDTAAKGEPGTFVVFDIADLVHPVPFAETPIGIGPDSVAVTQRGDMIISVVAIEDEELDEEGEATLGGKRPGRVDVLSFSAGDRSSLRVSSVLFPEELLQSVEGVRFAGDPQPEFVAIRPDGQEAAVTLQENNAVALIDISNPENPTVKRILCAGTVSRKADLKGDGTVDFSDDMTARREPDAIAYFERVGKTCLALANEGDTALKTFGDGVWSGGRGVSLIDESGAAVWDSGLALDLAAARRGHYPDSRSKNRGSEIEGVATARFFGDDLLIAASERYSAPQCQDTR